MKPEEGDRVRRRLEAVERAIDEALFAAEEEECEDVLVLLLRARRALEHVHDVLDCDPATVWLDAAPLLRVIERSELSTSEIGQRYDQRYGYSGVNGERAIWRIRRKLRVTEQMAERFCAVLGYRLDEVYQ